MHLPMWIRDTHDIANMSDWVVMHIRIHHDLEEYLFLEHPALFSILNIWIQKINNIFKI